jgi:hypothetical protein
MSPNLSVVINGVPASANSLRLASKAAWSNAAFSDIYIPYGTADTKVIEPMTDGMAGLAKGEAWAAS